MEKNIGTKIRQIRELKGYSQEYIADKLGISQRAYSKIETGKTGANWGRVTQIAEVLEVDPLDIAAFDDNLIFNNCSQSGKFDQFYNNMPNELIIQYEKRIEGLQEEVIFLKKLVLKQKE